ncbi:MAG TPA: carboxypeptidase regulatory-like domain-containing protein [Gemmatimonadaceae bacterium]
MSSRWRLLLVAVSLVLAGDSSGAQSTSEIIRGRVAGPDSLPIAGAEVRVTGLVSRMTQTARTDARGVYTLVFPNAEGEYLVGVRRVGFKSKSLRLSRVGMSPVLGTNIVLDPATQVLERVVVTAGPAITDDRTAIGEVASGALADSLFLADPSRLMELLLSIPGITSFDDSTFSVLGSAANQNITTLDGINVRGEGGLPPDALASMRVVTSSADPARGGFSGGNVTQTLRGGTDIFVSTLRVSGSNRGLVWRDPEWSRPTPRPVSHSGTANGPIIRQKLRYNVSWSVQDNTTDWYSLLHPRAPLLAQQGISVDSVAAVTHALNDLGVPLSLSSGPRDANSRNVRISEVLDFAPSATTSLRLSHRGSWQRSVGNGASLTSFPTRVNEVGSYSHNVGFRATGLIHGLLNELTAGVSYYADESDPFTLLPGGRVRVGTDFSDGRTGLSSLTFGGGNGDYYEQSWSGEASNELSWIPQDGQHRVKAGGRLSFDRSNYFYFPGSPLLGTYTYLTIDDLSANLPASYDRVIANAPRKTKSWNSALWVGEEWRASDAWQWQGGVRLDFAHPGTIPRYNSAVEETFGVRTDRVPRGVGLSPRIGFSWASPARRGRGTSGRSSTLGGLSASEIRSMSPDLVSALVSMQRASTLPGIGVTGTVGAYRGIINNGTIAELVESTGLPGTRITLSCVGDAVPIPDWDSMTEGPTACADGTMGTTFSIAQPLVRVFDPAFRAPVSWRGNLGVEGIRVPGQWIISLTGGFALNANVRSSIDLNLTRTPRFHLPDEANRPVYAPMNAIVPASGAISPGASRISPEFATVTSLVSDLRSYQAQLQASLSPPQPLFNRRVSLNLRYSFTTGRSESRGSSRVGTTGDPIAKQWVRNSQPMHTLRFTTSGRYWGINFGFSSYLYSGVPLTPLVSGDINGDGDDGNDRAFIPDPATTSDTSLARQLGELLSHARPVARRCISSQLDRMAGANSCRTPWQSRIDVTASLTPPSGWSYSDRLRLTFNLSSASGTLVRAFGLENTPFGQTSLSTTPNATLLYVTGFDPATKQFRYRVNQLFGQPTNFGSARRRFSPSQLHVGLEYTFGGPVINPIARGLGLREPPDRPSLTNAERRTAVARLKRDPVASYAALADSLGLTTEQLSQLGVFSREFDIRADTALQPLLDWVLSRGRRVFDRDLARPLAAAQSALSKLSAEYENRAQGVLTAEQLARFNELTERREKQLP